ncbi:MAG TPA: hypothetical protein VH600_14335 [Burkholderiales bacterium]|jgi:hypothetical protein
MTRPPTGSPGMSASLSLLRAHSPAMTSASANSAPSVIRTGGPSSPCSIE